MSKTQTKFGKAGLLLRKWQPLVKQAAKFLIVKTAVLEVALVASLVISHYLRNKTYTYANEIILPVLLLAPIILLTHYIYLKVLKNQVAVHIATICMVFTYYYFEYHYQAAQDLVRIIVPTKLDESFSTTVLAIIFQLIIFGLIGKWLDLRYNHTKLAKLLPPIKLMSYIIGFIFISQVARVVAYNVSVKSQINFDYKIPQHKKVATPTTKPDVYYIVFDRYGSSEMLREAYNFDNSDLTDFLKSHGFMVKNKAYSNYAFTTPSVSSTFAMDYLTQLQKFTKDKELTSFPFRSVLSNPPIAQILKDNGYSYHHIGSWWDSTAQNTKADSNLTVQTVLRLPKISLYLSESQRTVINESVIGRLLSDGIKFGRHHTLYIENLDVEEKARAVDQIKSVKRLAALQEQKPRFVFAHILMPHGPYVVDQDGAKPVYDPGENDVGADEKVKYINQLVYTNSLLKDMIKEIREKSPNSVVILQSDEGPYPKVIRGRGVERISGGLGSLTDEELKIKFSILAAYYYPNEESANKIKSSIDVFRVLLNDYLGYELSVLPECYYVDNEIINARLGVTLDNSCPQ